MDTEKCIIVSDLYKEYRKGFSSSGKKVLKGLSISVRKGEIYGLIGRNGAGKTTLLKCISGLVVPSSGKIEILGAREESELCIVRNKIGALINKPALDPDMSARENLNISAMRRGISCRDINKALDDVGLYNESNVDLDNKVRICSTGIKQRLGIAMAVMGKPDIVILDEPLNGLDPDGVSEIHELIMKMNNRGVTFVISSHLLRELDQVATRYGIIKNGTVLAEITSRELKEKGISLEDYYKMITGKNKCSD